MISRPTSALLLCLALALPLAARDVPPAQPPAPPAPLSMDARIDQAIGLVERGKNAEAQKALEALRKDPAFPPRAATLLAVL
ncbi:MAG TPA: hypothetical protein VGE98_12215, partial [Thermoanaerobaculia bacterium]